MDQMDHDMVDRFIDELRLSLPLFVTRADVRERIRSCIAPGTLANEDSRGTGPKCKMFNGRRVCYLREPFLDWLKEWIMCRMSKQKFMGKPVDRHGTP